MVLCMPLQCSPVLLKSVGTEVHFAAKSDQSLAKGRPKLMVRVIIRTQTWIISMKARAAAKTQFQTHSMSPSYTVCQFSVIQGCLQLGSSSAKQLRQVLKFRSVNTHAAITLKCVLLLSLIIRIHSLLYPFLANSSFPSPETHRTSFESPWDLSQSENSQEYLSEFLDLSSSKHFYK